MSRISDTVCAVERVILGKSLQVRLCLTCILARGHLLIEDVPGVGKTTLAHTLAHVLGLEWTRVQFTSDMLPADILGVSIFDRSTHKFQFRRGPIFTQLLLADEINRASPKAQSALLEAMEERQVTVDGETYPLPEPFFVVATQNPHEQIGTYGLPESQLDRFLMRVSLGYPDRASERRVLLQGERKEILERTPSVLNGEQVLAFQRAARSMHVADALLDYVQSLIARSRTQMSLGLSPRAAQGLLRAAQAWALLGGEKAVLPEHVQAVFPAIAAHRLEPRESDGSSDGNQIADGLIKAVPVPV
ncbi:MAG TPA: AAA family ATPase [Steroidobacteraceae bacterium]|jgi:MoxR-like ATPase|nr:AAA family ATPase [Steroidobacteraceae bacterium]